MSTTIKHRQSAIPTPGRAGSRSTPSRSRASSSVGRRATPTLDVDFVSRAFADAINSNDPASHRTSRLPEVSNESLSPHSTLPSGRQSVTGRPSSVASSTSATMSVIQRPRTPTSIRTPGRPSDTSGRSSSRNGKIFEIGDKVRIESLGFEGTLRFIGEIDGKVGIWAGVELSGGFSGKGKNDGTVNGKRYFVCSANCGVFVSTVKLSMPTVSRGGGHRPSSVASSRSGRHTPSSGRPSYPSLLMGESIASSNSHTAFSTGGRITPSRSLGSITPFATPAQSRLRSCTNSRALKNAATMSKASQSHCLETFSTSGRGIGSKPEHSTACGPLPNRPRNLGPWEIASNIDSSNEEGEGSTVLPRYGRTSQSIRARITSATAMPPPPSPVRPPSSVITEDYPGNADEWTSGYDTQGQASLASTSPSRPSSASLRDLNMTPGPSDVVIQLPGTRSSSHCREDHEQVQFCSRKQVNGTIELLQDVEELEIDDNRTLSNQISDLQAQLQRSEANVVERDSKAESLRQALLKLEEKKAEDEHRLRDLERRLSESITSCDSLKEMMQLRAARDFEHESILAGKNAKIVELESQVRKLCTQSDFEKKELLSQVEELRRAGQETIALYEERLNDAETKRFELEARIDVMEKQLGSSEPITLGPGFQHDSAAQIDNESLRDHVHHLQRKIIALEDKLEEVQAVSENEGIILREKVKRFKEREETMRKELDQGRREAEQALKAEASARLRQQEIEEALRENTSALEDARAEVEGLRTELADIGSSVDNDDKRYQSSDMSDVRDLKAPSQEITRLKSSMNNAKFHSEQRCQQRNSISSQDTVRVLEKRNRNSEPENLAEEGHATNELRRPFANHTGTQQLLTASTNVSQGILLKNNEAIARDEITGLKLIVHELQQENSIVTQKIKLLETENDLFRSETEQLRQEIKILEDGFEQSILHEEQGTTGMSCSRSSMGDINGLQTLSNEQKTKFESELDHLRKKLAEAEMKNARLTFESNKEISELETLIESKIYREDELETELESIRAQLAQLQKQASISRHLLDSNRPTSTFPHDTICEICEKPGHDIFSCSLLKGDPKVTSNDLTSRHISGQLSRNDETDNGIFCEDCESYGHSSMDCPHSLDVF